MKKIAFSLLLLAASFPARAQQPAAVTVDVLVYGGSSAGVIAAYTARMYGLSVLLVEPGRHLGGMTSGGLGQTDIGNKYAVSGLALDFYRRVGQHYGWFEAWQFEPHVAERVFDEYVDEARVEVWYSRRLKALEKVGTEIERVTLEHVDGGSPDLSVGAHQFIDATYEGDLMAKSGASYYVGRESNSVYDETLNGVQLRGRHQFPDGIDPYVEPGDPSSGLVPEITGIGIAENGTGDRGVQAYNFRMCLCQGADRLRIEKPPEYNPDRYELLLRRIAAEQTDSLNQLFIISRMPNGKTDWNNRGGFSTDYIGKNWEYPGADYAGRARIWKDHEQYQKGLIYFLANDARVPEHLREEMQSWGYCRDEFRDTDGWPHALYVREARRLVGEYVMTEHNSVGREVVDDGIALAAYTMDSHNVQRVVVDGIVKNEGNVEVGGWPDDDLQGAVRVEPYPISYRSITPKREEVTNLLVPVGLSASHIAFGSIRMEPVFMVLGQAAGVAAAMAVESGTSVQQIDVPALRRELKDNPLADGSPPEIVVDDGDGLELDGNWTPDSPEGKYGLTALRNDSASGRATFRPELETGGTYRVYLYWPRSDDLATNVAVEIGRAGGVERLTLNMRQPDEVHGGLQHGIVSWVRLGEFTFTPGQSAYLTLDADGVDGVVFADAVLFEPVGQ